MSYKHFKACLVHGQRDVHALTTFCLHRGTACLIFRLLRSQNVLDAVGSKDYSY